MGSPITLTFSGDTAASVSLLTLTRTDTGATVGSLTLPAAFTDATGGTWTRAFTEPAVGLSYAYTYRVTWADGSTYDGAGTETGAVSSWDGYYTHPAGYRRKAGEVNAALYSRLDNDLTTEDPVILQAYADEIDRYVDFLAEYVSGWASADVPILTTHGLHDAISDAATDLLIVKVYGARGMNDPQVDEAAGKMEDKRAKADAYLRELLATRGTVTVDDDESFEGAAPIALTPTGAACGCARWDSCSQTWRS